MRLAVLFAASAACVLGSQLQIGGGAGYGMYRRASIYAADAKATAGIRSRFALTSFLRENRYDRLGGEFRYTYQDGDPFIESGGIRANIQGQSHAFTYNALFYGTRRDSRVRPYVLAGAGGKQYVVTGPEIANQPLAEIGKLTSTSEWKPVVAAGLGAEMRLSRNVTLDACIIDYVTPFPKRIIVAPPGATPRGLFQQITPLVSLSYGF